MIDDDATPEELDAWYRRTPDEIATAKQAKWNDDIGRHVRCESSDPDDRLAPHLACQPPGLRLRLDAPQPYQNLPTTSATTLDAYCVFLLKRPLVRHMLYARYYVAIAQS